MRAAFVLPYFGCFDSLFPFFLQSCGANPKITWIIITDNSKTDDCPENVLFHKMSFGDLQKHIQSFYDFPVSLPQPYKLCDFKPAYGEIFAQYLDKFDYWGYCDCDLLWGKIQTVVEKNMGRCDQIGRWGHCSLYRNEKHLTELYRSSDAYKIAFANHYSFLFDELGFQKLLRKFSISQAPLFELGDFYPRHFTFESVAPCGPEADSNSAQIFTLEKDGTLLRHYLQGGELACNEIYYIHFLKRRMEIALEAEPGKRLLIIPNRITTSEVGITSEIVRKSTEDCFYKNYWKYGLTPKLIWKKLIQRFSLKRKSMLKKIMALAEGTTVVQ